MVYNLLLAIFFLVNIPKIVYEYIFLKKKKNDLLQRLGFSKYNFDLNNKPLIIWIHAVSLGETKAASLFFQNLKKKYPKAYFIISSTTQTAHNEAKKSLSSADRFVFLPFDFSFVINKLFKKIKPNIVIFVETDIWYNFIRYAKKNNAKLYLVSAKISDRSTRRYLIFKKYAKRIFSNFDKIFTQNEDYYENFLKIGLYKSILENSFNIKLLNFSKSVSEEEKNIWKDKLSIREEKVITIASTHPKEEENILKSISINESYKILIAPRHPERFNEVDKLLKNLKLNHAKLSDLDKNINAKIILIDRMGILNNLFAISDISIVGGSFVSKIGGHNILEPSFQNSFVFFGPNMFNQKELKEISLHHKIAKEVSLENIDLELKKYLYDKSYINNLDSFHNFINSKEKELFSLIEKITC